MGGDGSPLGGYQLPANFPAKAAPVAQLVEQRTLNPWVAGSNPARRSSLCLALHEAGSVAQIGESVSLIRTRTAVQFRPDPPASDGQSSVYGSPVFFFCF